MNYIAEINAFYDWLELNPLSTSAIVLWHTLMHINNKSKWTNEFTVAASVLSLKSGLTDRTIRNARNELKQKGRIDWKTRGGNKAAAYILISLSEIDSDSLSVNVTDSLSDTTSDSLSTLDKHKLNYTKQSIYIDGEEKVLSNYLIKTLEILLADRSYIEMLCMNNRIQESALESYLKKFFVDLAARGEKTKDERDAKFHFANWLKKEIREEVSNAKNRQFKSKQGSAIKSRTGEEAGIKSMCFD